MSDIVENDLPEQAKDVPQLYMVILVTLGAAFLFGLVAWFVLILQDKTMPDGFSTILALIAGGLIGVIAPQAANQNKPG